MFDFLGNLIAVGIFGMLAAKTVLEQQDNVLEAQPGEPPDFDLATVVSRRYINESQSRLEVLTRCNLTNKQWRIPVTVPTEFYNQVSLSDVISLRPLALVKSTVVVAQVA